MASTSRIRSTKAQINYLCQYMAQHKDLATAVCKTPQNIRDVNEQWERLKETLDNLGPSRSIIQWKSAWRDQRRKAKREKSMNHNSVVEPESDSNSQQSLDASRLEMEIDCSREESPVEFSVPTIVTSYRKDVDDPLQPRASPPYSPRPAGTSRRCTRPRKLHPSIRLLKAHEAKNQLLEAILQELRYSNKLRQEHNNLLLRQLNNQRQRAP